MYNADIPRYTQKIFKETGVYYASDLYEISLCEGSRHAPEAGDMMVKRLLEMSNELYK